MFYLFLLLVFPLVLSILPTNNFNMVVTFLLMLAIFLLSFAFTRIRDYFKKPLKINKKVLKMIAKSRVCDLGYILKELKLATSFRDDSDYVIIEEKEELKSLFYTLDFLLNEKMIIISSEPADLKVVKIKMLNSFLDKQLKIFEENKILANFSLDKYIENNYQTREDLLRMFTIMLPLFAAFFSVGLSSFFEKIKSDEKNSITKIKIEQSINAEISENLYILSQYIDAKNQISSDVAFVFFIQNYRFNTEALKIITAENFTYLENNDLYLLTTIKSKMDAFNQKLNKLEENIVQNRRLSEKIDCNFLHFSPENKEGAHRFLNDDMNRLVNSIKKLSFFNEYYSENLKPTFDLTDSQVSLFNFQYNPDYKKVYFNCD